MPVFKYNPAFQPDDEKTRSHVIHPVELRLILRILRENNHTSNQHVLLIGPRGSGKSTLALRVAAEARLTPDLREQWFPIVFGEESYMISSAGRFWLETLMHLGNQANDPKCQAAYQDLTSELDDDRLRSRALGRLLDFADSRKCRLLLVVENLQMLLGQQISDSDAWKLRETFAHEPRIMLLGSATCLFPEISEYRKPFYEQLRSMELKPLDTAACAALWKEITGHAVEAQQMRPLQILTGGNPRLLTILASADQEFSLGHLLEDLKGLIDSHTDYLKSFLDNLAPTERRAYLALAEIWDPASAREVAQKAGLTANEASSLLKRLVARGAVMETALGKRKHEYQTTERLYNLYYLMRRHSGQAGRAEAAVKFMASFYAPEDLIEKTRRIAEEACSLPPEARQLHQYAVLRIAQTLPDKKLQTELLNTIPQKFFDEAPEEYKTSYSELLIPANKRRSKKQVKIEVVSEPMVLRDGGQDWQALFEKAKALFALPTPPPEAESTLKAAIAAVPDNIEALLKLVKILAIELKKPSEIKSILTRALTINPKEAKLWGWLGYLSKTHSNNSHQAILYYQKAIRLKPDYAWAWANLGLLMHDKFDNFPEAERCYRKAIEINPNYAWAWAQLGRLLHGKLDNFPEAERCYRKAIEINPNHDTAWANLGLLLYNKLDNSPKAEHCYRKAIEIKPKYAWAWAQLGRLLHDKLDKFPEAERCYRKAIEIDPKLAWAWAHLGQLLHEKLNNYPEAEQCYRKTIELTPEIPYAWEQLFEMLWQQRDNHQEIGPLLESACSLQPANAELLNTLAWKAFLTESADYLPKAEAMAKRAGELAPQNGAYLHTYASILLALGKPAEALDYARKFLEDVEFLKYGVSDAIELFVGLAAAGHGKEAVQILRAAPSAHLLEPLVAGLRIYLGEEVKVAREILEVGKDVAQRITERAAKKATATAPVQKETSEGQATACPPPSAGTTPT